MKIIGVITHFGEGQISQGKSAGSVWQMITVEGLPLFLPNDLHGDYCRGQRVRCELLYTGDKKRVDSQGKDLGYQAGYQVLSVEVLQEVLFE